jgi:hypothetical protein
MEKPAGVPSGLFRESSRGADDVMAGAGFCSLIGAEIADKARIYGTFRAMRTCLRTPMENRMKTITAIAAVSMLALAVSSASAPASARNGGAIAAGVVGGLAVGAIVGSQVNRNYYGGPAYAEPTYVVEPRGYCHTERREVVDAYGNYRVRRVRVCD